MSPRNCMLLYGLVFMSFSNERALGEHGARRIEPRIYASRPASTASACFRAYQSEIDTCGYDRPEITWNRGPCAGTERAMRQAIASAAALVTIGRVSAGTALASGRHFAESVRTLTSRPHACTVCLDNALNSYQRCLDAVSPPPCGERRWIAPDPPDSIMGGYHHIFQTRPCPSGTRCCYRSTYWGLGFGTVSCRSDFVDDRSICARPRP